MIRGYCLLQRPVLWPRRGYASKSKELQKSSRKKKIRRKQEIDKLRERIRLSSHRNVHNHSTNLEDASKYNPLPKYCSPNSEIPGLCHNLDRVLFSPGVHYMQDPRTRKYNFSPDLKEIPSIDDFRFDLIAGFVPPNKDPLMVKIGEEINASSNENQKSIKYFSSTSSMTNTLKHFHMLLSNYRPCHTSNFSKEFSSTTEFSKSTRCAAFTVVAPKGGGILSVGADRSTDTEIALSLLGHELELMLTAETKEFQKFLKHSDSEEAPAPLPNNYQYARIGSFLMRSQSDAKSDMLPGTGIFDLKTRAVCAVRHDINYNNYHLTNYEIVRNTGLYESFERELFDLVRTGLWKYSMQARIGNMDGIFIAYHNMRRFFGFQYLPTTEIDHIFHGYDGPRKSKQNYDDVVNDFGNHWQTKREALSSFMADFEFRVSMEMWQAVLDLVTKETNHRPFRLITKCDRNILGTYLDVVATVVDEDMLKNLSTLGDDIVTLDKEDLAATQKDELPMERIIRLAESRSLQHKRMLSLNKDILDSTLGDPSKCLMFRITATHYFNGKLFRGKYPTPPLDILDEHQHNTWEVRYNINRIYNRRKIRRCYNRYVTEAASSLQDHPVNRENTEKAYMDQKASPLQRLLRAYSAKSEKRKKLYGANQ
ncbi:hypothetical protein KL944_000312 [Ogataea haglerorum]|nr:hypothetical protein KL944_000312 [Ogataea haglerorum]